MERYTRRQVLRGAATAAVGLGLATFSGCSSSENKVNPTPEPKKTVEYTPINQELVTKIGKVAVDNVNRVLGLNLPDETVNEIILVNNLVEYQRIIKESEVDYVSSDELWRFAITSGIESANGKKVYLYQPAIVNYTRNLPLETEEGLTARDESIEYIITHELMHYSAAIYKSQKLYHEVYEVMFSNLLEGKPSPLYIDGAEVKATVSGLRKAVFSNLEECEAFILGHFVMKNRGVAQKSTFLTADEAGVGRQLPVLEELLKEFGPNRNENLKLLSKLRAEKDGRDKLCEILADKYEVKSDSKYLFALTLLFAVESGDMDLLKRTLPK